MGGCTVLCGAGISLLPPSRLPDGSTLARRLIELVLDGPVVFDGEAFDEVLAALRPRPDGEQDLRLELVFELLAHELDPGLLVEVFRLLEGAAPNANHYGLLLSGAAEILTLNQDVLFEQAAQALGHPDPDDCVVHLHGRCDQPATIVTLISQYLAGLPPGLADSLRVAVEDRVVVVIGYSGRDRDVMPALAQAKPREVRWVRYAHDGKPQPLSPELATLQADLGPRLILDPQRDPSAWLARQLGPAAASQAALAAGGVHVGPSALSTSVVSRFAAIDERARNLALGRLLRHVGQLEALHDGLQRLRRRKAGRHPEVELALAAAIADLGDRGRAARRYAGIATRHADQPVIVCEALLARGEALANESHYRQARQAFAGVARSARRLSSRRRKHYQAWALEREARMRGMTDQEASALRAYARAQRLFDQLHEIDGRITTRTFAADLVRSRGRYHQALRVLEEVLTDGALFSRSYYKPWPRFYHAITAASMGMPDAGLEELEQAEAIARAVLNWQAVAWIAVLRCCFERARSLDAAEDALAAAERVIRDHGKRLTLAHARVLFEHADLPAPAAMPLPPALGFSAFATGSPTTFPARCRTSSPTPPLSRLNWPATWATRARPRSLLPPRPHTGTKARWLARHGSRPACGWQAVASRLDGWSTAASGKGTASKFGA
jgi:tetratricopeptide (TPR) repeat protein